MGLRKPPGLFRRLASLLVLGWLLGFLWFALFLPRPTGDARTDAVIALTGSSGRIEHAIDVLRDHHAARLLVSGVGSEVRAAEFMAQYHVDPALFACCVTLGYDAVDTRSNALEAARWITRKRIRSVRLVTTDWHMRRAAFDLRAVAPADLVIVEDAVPSRPSMKGLFLEYCKYLARIATWAIDRPVPVAPEPRAHG